MTGVEERNIPIKLNLPLSLLSQGSKIIFLYNRIKARINGLNKQFKYNKELHKETLSQILDHETRELQHLLDCLDIIIRQQDERVLSISLLLSSRFRFEDFRPLTVYKTVFREFKTYPKNLESHCIKIFGRFTKFKYDDEFRLKILRNKRDYFRYKGNEGIVQILNKRIEQDEEVLEFMRRYLQKVKNEAKLSARSEHMAKLALEMEDRLGQGWFMIFNTLTVEPEVYRNVFPFLNKNTDSGPKLPTCNPWHRYIRTIDCLFGHAAFGSIRKAKLSGKDYHSYFAVVEKGGKTGRLHIHVLHMFKTMPVEFSDPNKGLTHPYEREVTHLKKNKYWPSGHSTPIAVRLGGNDAWMRKGWVWPVKQLKNSDGTFKYQDLEPKPVLCMVRYLGKYITKSYNEIDTGGGLWRIRISRNLAKKTMTSRLTYIPKKMRFVMLKMSPIKIPFGIAKVPFRMMKRILMKMMNAQDLKKLFQRALLDPVVNFYAQIRDIIEGNHESNQENYGGILITNMRRTAVFSHFTVTEFKYIFGGLTYEI